MEVDKDPETPPMLHPQALQLTVNGHFKKQSRVMIQMNLRDVLQNLVQMQTKNSVRVGLTL